MSRINNYFSFLADYLFHLRTGLPNYQRRYQQLKKSNSVKFTNPEFDIVYVLPPSHLQGWILDAICREIDTYYDAKSAFVSYPDKLPSSKSYFYSHYAYFRDVLLEQPNVLEGRNILFYTHPKEDLWFSQEELIHSFKYADNIISMSSMYANKLEEQGLKNVFIEHVGANPKLFLPHNRGKGAIGFCSSYYLRKNGDCMLEVIKKMPHLQFKLCGRNWEKWERWSELNNCKNFEYLQLSYSDYPKFYESLDVFVSVSKLEGGPIPLLESMMCNVVPVASRIGHAPDIITHNKNGFLFEVDSTVDEICELVEQAITFKVDVSTSVQEFTWQRFSQSVQRHAGLLN
jgi:glycosyltransferase involved in cell wall biosynthesis